MPKPPRPRPVRPPQLADRLLEWFCAPHLLEEVQGDLHERFYRRAVLFGERSARRQYVWEVLGFLKPFAVKRKSTIHRRGEFTSTFSLSPAMIRNYIKTAFRNLTKHKVSTLINTLGLTLGVTACLVIYVIISYELSFDTFHPDNDRIFRVVGEVSTGKSAEAHPVGFIPRAAPNAIRSEVSGLETVAAFHNLHSHVLIPEGPKQTRRFEAGRFGADRAEIVIADPQYFDIFRYEWLAGNPKTSLNEPFKVVLSEQKARTYFGNVPIDNMLGREVIYRDSIRTTVSGIVKDWNHNTDFTFTDFISAATIRTSFLKGEINLDEWNDIWSSSQTFVKLAKGTSPAEVDARLATFGKAHRNSLTPIKAPAILGSFRVCNRCRTCILITSTRTTIRGKPTFHRSTA
ncbi:permease prefix domain 2-containing transporter [Fibrisoma limi]|uniref:permease prefix domain 2-containing transporter n=1 Tax=Fibrisoma limi TaxID=663275 RepID=UPI0002E4AB65|nr:permease prefix domain 2-containing transporter [Fibrisoma limi]